MKVSYQMQTPWPVGVKNPQRFEACDWEQSGDIPFVPVAGMMIDCGDGDLREALQVYWTAEKPDEIAVYFEDDTPRQLSYWVDGGWRSNDFKMPRGKRVAP